ncbi:MAG TPA: histidine kinase dimerization/phospho-acceptor domain-containing protein [Methylomirabilota bacterium]|nr:histidine kinase dimerization/phospho-acceptor domain-containing protein [Methylomirabilota bacterium]
MKPMKVTARGEERWKKKRSPIADQTGRTDANGPARAERADQEAETLRSVATLAAAVSHEINNPLMAVMINLELLESTHKLDAYGRERLEEALAAAGVIKEKVRRFEQITRLEIADDGPALPRMLDLEKSSRGVGIGPSQAGDLPGISVRR